MERVSSCSCDGDRDGYDAIVVGSGYGGAVAACRMAMAGIKVCLIEKGRRWEGVDFPTSSFEMIKATRLEFKSWGFSFGREAALFQVHGQGDSLAVVACGVGGGSLVNAAVMVPTPARVRNNHKWPKEWEKDWYSSQNLALAMLSPRIPPMEFSSSRVMKAAAGDIEDYHKPTPLMLGINFDNQRDAHSTNPRKLGDCLACGNCLSGCPYDAKASTDKNYISLALQVGCKLKTECQVQFITTNPCKGCNETETRKCDGSGCRRWRVYLDDVDYLSSDFVVVSAGVLGTTEILLRSSRRGLKLSERLGHNYSCNGNNVACIAGSAAPLNGQGLHRNRFSQVPFNDRPGPAITTSYSSSLGFTIQTGVLPNAYPHLLFNGIITYGWPNGFWFLHGMLDKIKNHFGLKSTQAIALNTMGYDSEDGRIRLDDTTEKVVFVPPSDPILPLKIQAFQKIAKRVGGILFMSRFRSTSVHLLGGCNAASDATIGVCNPSGQVFHGDSKSATAVHSGLYVCDASLIPCSIGINPCLTIAAAAEHVAKQLVQDVKQFKTSCSVSAEVDDANSNRLSSISASYIDDGYCEPKRQMVVIRETMMGRVGGMPCTLHLTVKMSLGSNTGKSADQVKGSSREPDEPLLWGRVGGFMVFNALHKDRLYIIDGEVDMCKVETETPYTQYMRYCLLLADSSGCRYFMEGRKIMNPYMLGLCAWKESTTLHVVIRKLGLTEDGVRVDDTALTPVEFKGELRVSAGQLLKSLLTMKGSHKGRFVFLLLHSLFTTYILQRPRGRLVDGLTCHTGMKDEEYPPSVVHHIKTEDGVGISCLQWVPRGEQQKYPVLLLNGHSTETYHLPSEPKDLVRTLLEQGYVTWLLRPRVHPLHASNDFTIEDMAKFDIPAALSAIRGVHGDAVKVHVIGHCVGGLIIHMALLGGHISASNVASLCCTNSSMFFKVTTSSLVKMWLPLVPLSMLVLGRKRMIPLFENSETDTRHKLLKFIAHFIPRYERCTCDECEVFSGIFGNAFWHENVSHSLHQWLNKEFLSTLTMAAFPHLRKICNSGFIVDSNGRNVYLKHPERLTLPTLYISGGRPCLVTPETTLLANKYMRLHHPHLHHKRIVVEGFGHSDLIMGKESHVKVFPHIIDHLKLTQEANSRSATKEASKYARETIEWEHSEDESHGHFSPWLSFRSLCLLLVILVFVHLIGLHV